MFVVIVETQVDAEARSGEPAFLARLELDDNGEVLREFGLEVVDFENRRALTMVAMPGQMFLARRWWSTEAGDTGGLVYFTVNELGDVCPLPEHEALARLKAGAPAQANGAVPLNGSKPRPAGHPPEAPPANIFCRPATLSGKTVFRGRL